MAFTPTFDWIQKEWLDKGEYPACLIYFTDLECGDLFDMEDPGYPVLWVTPKTKYAYLGGNENLVTSAEKWGQVIFME